MWGERGRALSEGARDDGVQERKGLHIRLDVDNVVRHVGGCVRESATAVDKRS